LCIGCTDIQDRAVNEAIADVTGPDGTVLRFHWITGEPGSCTGLIFNGDARPGHHRTTTTSPKPPGD
jgi:hypothetical protein